MVHSHGGQGIDMAMMTIALPSRPMIAGCTQAASQLVTLSLFRELPLLRIFQVRYGPLAIIGYDTMEYHEL